MAFLEDVDAVGLADRAAALEQLRHRRAQAREPRLGHVVGQHEIAFVEELLALRRGQDVGRMLQHVLRLHGVLRVVMLIAIVPKALLLR